MNWETQPGSILWDLFASEVSYQEKIQQQSVAQAVVDAGGATICTCCGQVIAVAAVAIDHKISTNQPAMQQAPTTQAMALQVAQDKASLVQNSMDSDMSVMKDWITQAQSMGVDFYNDPNIQNTLRQEVLQALWDQDEERRVAVYAQIQSAKSEQLDSLNVQYQDILNHQQIITDLMAGSCTWTDS